MFATLPTVVVVARDESTRDRKGPAGQPQGGPDSGGRAGALRAGRAEPDASADKRCTRYQAKGEDCPMLCAHLRRAAPRTRSRTAALKTTALGVL